MTKQDLFLLIALIFLVVATFGSYAGYTTSGIEYGGWSSANVTSVSAVSTGLGFMTSLLTFQLDGIPAWLSAFFALLSLCELYLIIQLIRGT